MRPKRPPAENARSHALVEASRPRWLLDLDERSLERADPRRQHAVVDLGEPQAAPSPCDRKDRQRGRRSAGDDNHGKHGGREKRSEHGQAHEVRECEAEAERSDEGVREAKRHLTGSPAP
jgi:hypothetical protein